MKEEKELSKKRMRSEKIGNHLFIFWNGKMIYKRWLNKTGEKTQPSILLNENGWPNEWVT